MQLAFDLVPRAEGERLGNLSTDKAERVADFDTVGASKFIVGWLHRHGNVSGEALTNAAKEHGYRPHDDRAFGSIFGTLSRKGLIRCVGYCERMKGHGTAGGRVWAAQQ